MAPSTAAFRHCLVFSMASLQEGAGPAAAGRVSEATAAGVELGRWEGRLRSQISAALPPVMAHCHAWLQLAPRPSLLMTWHAHCPASSPPGSVAQRTGSAGGLQRSHGEEGHQCGGKRELGRHGGTGGSRRVQVEGVWTCRGGERME